MRSTYEATAIRDGRWWLITVPAIDGVTQARRLFDAEKMARELIAVTLDADIDDISVNVHIGFMEGIDVDAELEVIKRARTEAVRLDAEATTKATTLARSLAGMGVPLRDIGAALGVTHQRVHQLVNK